MSRKQSLVSYVLLLAIIGACKPSADQAGTLPVSNTPIPSPTPIGQEMLTIINELGEEELIPKPSPDFVDAIFVHVETGELTLEEAVIASLRIIAGEILPREIHGDQPVSFQTGRQLTLIAVELYHSTTNDDVRAEIARLLNIIAPPQENIDRYAQPEGEAGTRAPGLAMPGRSNPLGPVDCETIWAEGFPTDVEEPPVCLLYRSFTEEGYEYRIYYPEERRGDGDFLTYVEAATQALRDSRATYDPLSEIRSINLIFTLLPSPLDSLAEVPGLLEASHGGAPCPISVFPPALDITIPEFKQTIAHEVFHCLHFFRAGSTGGSAEDWYAEGMAEYFSNVVYPTVNSEYQWEDDFAYNSLSQSLMDMEYENAIFFQYLGNVFGDEYLLNMLDVLAAAGGTSDTQAAALAGFADMQTIFHEFGQFYFMKDIPDTGGGSWPITYFLQREDIYEIGDGRDMLLSAFPFTLRRFGMNFEEDLVYEISRSTGGATGEDSWRPPRPEGFEEIPESISTFCQTDPTRLVLLTSAPAGATMDMRSDLQLSFVSAEGGYMDCCLVGTWAQGTEEIRSHLETIVPLDATILDVSGQFLMAITAEGTTTFVPQDYSATMELNDDDIAMFYISGVSVAEITVPEEGTIITLSNIANFEGIVTTGDGLSISVPLEGFGGVPEGEWNYTCSETTLTTIIPVGLAPFETTTYSRISDIPTIP
ncbi:MAG: hypothetical protein WEC37_01895 [Anaerolineales bacterium]